MRVSLSRPISFAARSPAGDEQRRLLPADRDHRHDRDVALEREPDEALAAAELDLVAVPAGPERLVVAAGVDEHGRAEVERGARVVV